MKWYYAGDMAIHYPDGKWDIEQVDGVFDLPDSNVALIRSFLYANRELILQAKYHPTSGEAPWGDNQSQGALHQQLSALMSDDEWAVGVKDKQTKAYLVAFYHHLLSNIDLYCAEYLAA